MQLKNPAFILIAAVLAFTLASCDQLYLETSAVKNNAYVLSVFLDGNKVKNEATFEFEDLDIADLGVAVEFLVKNDGLQTVSFQVPVLSGTSAAEFSLTTPSATTLEPGKSVTMKLTFDPASVGAKSALLTVKNSAGTAVFTQSLSGAATDKTTVAAAIPSLESGTVFLSAAPLKISLSSATAGAAIFYTVDGTTPATSAGGSTLAYNGQFTGQTTTFTLKTIATRSGLANSPVTSATYNLVTPVVMTNGTGGGSSWGAELGTIETAVAGSNLLVNVNFDTTDSGNNVYLILDNADITTGFTSVSGDLTTGWGDFGITDNTAAFNPDFIAWGWRDGTTFMYSGAKTLSGTDGTSVQSSVTVTQSNANATISFLIPLSTLKLDATHNHLKAVVLFGKNVSDGGLHSAIPAAIDTDGYSDISEVASATLGL